MTKRRKIVIEDTQTGEIFETNSLMWEEVLGSKLVSAFVQDSLVRLYFQKDDGNIIRIKIPLDYYGMFEIIEIDRDGRYRRKSVCGDVRDG